MLTVKKLYRSAHLSLWAGLGEDRTLSDAALGQGDTGPAMSGDDVLVSATLSPGHTKTISGLLFQVQRLGRVQWEEKMITDYVKIW